jgi:hypothetical protein
MSLYTIPLVLLVRYKLAFMLINVTTSAFIQLNNERLR